MHIEDTGQNYQGGFCEFGVGYLLTKSLKWILYFFFSWQMDSHGA